MGQRASQHEALDFPELVEMIISLLSHPDLRRTALVNSLWELETRKHLYKKSKITFKSITEISRYLEITKEIKECPSTIHLPTPRNMETIQKFALKAAKYVLDLIIPWEMENIDEAPAWECIGQFPNLTSLYLEILPIPVPDNVVADEQLDPAGWANLVPQLPIPPPETFPYWLEELKVCFPFEYSRKIAFFMRHGGGGLAAAIINRTPHIKKLSISGNAVPFLEEIARNPNNFPNLRQFTVSGGHFRELEINTPAPFNRIVQPITHIEIYMTIFEDYATWGDVLERFSLTLKRLCFSVENRDCYATIFDPAMPEDADDAFYWLRIPILPKLEELKMSVTGYDRPGFEIGPICHIKSLSTLRTPFHTQFASAELVDGNCVRKINPAIQFPSLKKLVIRKESNFRAIWNNWRRRNYLNYYYWNYYWKQQKEFSSWMSTALPIKNGTLLALWDQIFPVSSGKWESVRELDLDLEDFSKERYYMGGWPKGLREHDPLGLCSTQSARMMREGKCSCIEWVDDSELIKRAALTFPNVKDDILETYRNQKGEGKVTIWTKLTNYFRRLPAQNDEGDALE